MTPEERAKIFEHSPEDASLYQKLTADLPTLAGLKGTGLDSNGEPMKFGLGPHSVKCISEVAALTNPTSILEIGFNVGYSAAMWLHFTQAKLVSVDISTSDETATAARLLKEMYPNRFHFIREDSGKVLDRIQGWKFDLIFIDGGHLEPDVVNDISLGLALNVKYFCFDDWQNEWGPGVQPAFNKSSLELMKVMGNIALARNPAVA